MRWHSTVDSNSLFSNLIYYDLIRVSNFQSQAWHSNRYYSLTTIKTASRISSPLNQRQETLQLLPGKVDLHATLEFAGPWLERFMTRPFSETAMKVSSNSITPLDDADCFRRTSNPSG